MCGRFYSGYSKSLFGYVLILPSLLSWLSLEPGAECVAGNLIHKLKMCSALPIYKTRLSGDFLAALFYMKNRHTNGLYQSG